MTSYVRTILGSVIPITWTVLLFIGGSMFIDFAFKHPEPYGRWLSILMPLYFMLWVITLYVGHSLLKRIGKLVTGNKNDK